MENLKCMICVIFLFTYNKFMVISSDSLDCNFDDGFCNWRQDQSDDFNWTRWSGETPTHNTGPDSDYTSGEGYYVYIDSRKVEKNKKARLISTTQSPGKYCFSLWYFMYGKHVGQLILSTTKKGTKSAEMFVLTGQMGQKWILKQALIHTEDSFEIIIEGTVKNQKWHGRGDIAVDDIVMFSSNDCPVDCGDPVPEFGHANSRDIEIGSKVNITCQTGYYVTGDPSIVCQANGTWSDNPVCRRVDCSDPSPQSGIVNSTSFQYGMTVKVTCKPGYKIIGKSVILCQANSTWTENPVCEQIESETSAIITVYVTVPIIVVFLAALLAVYILRKGHAHSAKRDGNQSVTDMNPAIHFPNKTYDKHDLIGRNTTTKQFKPKDIPRPDDEYADVNDDIRTETTEGVYYNTFDSECRIQNDTEHHYDHMKCISKPVPDNTYSHVHGNNIDIEWKPSNDTKLIQVKINAPLRRNIELENDNYDNLDNNNPDETMKREHSTTLMEEQESEYDHAKAGGIDPVPLDQDDYSHIRDGKVNHEQIENERCIRVQCEYSNVPVESTRKIKLIENERKCEYEEPISHSPQYFVLEAENENKIRDELETGEEQKNDGNYEPFNHTYFVLEKIESS